MNKEEIKKDYYNNCPNCFNCEFAQLSNRLIGLKFMELDWCDLKDIWIKHPRLKAKFCKQYCPKEEK